MKWRRILDEEVKAVVAFPDNVQETIKNRKNAFKRIGGRVLKVTYRIEHDKVLVITVITRGE